ncbi:MAG: proton-conducting transporter membrane subunit [Candidatus Omnitrophota bacterium]|nr:proton-conducting transporter membrane subunit [Candidatus Omnitrophota bacterium]
MMVQALLLILIIPLISGVIMFFIPKKERRAQEGLLIIASLANFILAVSLFPQNFTYRLPWLDSGIELSFRLYNFSSFMLLSTAFFGFLIALYSVIFMRGRNFLNQFYGYFLLCIFFSNAVFLSDNLLVLFFFWEGLLLSLFGMIAVGNKEAFKTATKAFIIIGVTDLCMMLGIALTGHLSGTMTLSKINLPLNNPLASITFILLMIGAISKGGAMPFHSWIPDAATDAPLPFMSFVPGAMEKLLGIYFLTRISLDLFQLNAQSGLSTLLMSIGGITIILAVMMALIQKDYKRLLSYHAISQVGYMILGVGTALPAGIVGGLFHMINNALYKSGLFLTAGSVEKQAGTTDLGKLGGLGRVMPVTFGCFLITALAISGVWPFNGFFSKELVYDAAIERGMIFYLAAVVGSFFTAASFLKLGHAAFLGKLSSQNEKTKEAAGAMLIPMIVIAAACVIFGLFNQLPLKYLIQPILGDRLEGHNFSGFPVNITLVVITFVVLFLALANHLFGAKIKGSGLAALDHIRYAPALSKIYDLAEKRLFDPYHWGLGLVNIISKLSLGIDRGINWLSDGLSVRLAYGLSSGIRKAHTGNYSVYLSWSIAGMLIIFVILIIL